MPSFYSDFEGQGQNHVPAGLAQGLNQGRPVEQCD
jgi:hypothetical protein